MPTDLKPFLQTCREVAASLKPNSEDYDNLLYFGECLEDAWNAILPVVCRGLLLVTFPISVPVCAYLLRKWAREDEARRTARRALADSAARAIAAERKLAQFGGRHERQAD